jgi:hypothetical protein
MSSTSKENKEQHAKRRLQKLREKRPGEHERLRDSSPSLMPMKRKGLRNKSRNARLRLELAQRCKWLCRHVAYRRVVKVNFDRYHDVLLLARRAKHFIKLT